MNGRSLREGDLVQNRTIPEDDLKFPIRPVSDAAAGQHLHRLFSWFSNAYEAMVINPSEIEPFAIDF